MSDSRNASLCFFAAMCGAGYLRNGDLSDGFRPRVLLLETAAGTEERALDGRPRHVHPLGDLAVRQALELAQHKYAVMVLRQLAERLAQLVEPLLVEECGLGARVRPPDEPKLVGRPQRVVLVNRDLLCAA